MVLIPSQEGRLSRFPGTLRLGQDEASLPRHPPAPVKNAGEILAAYSAAVEVRSSDTPGPMVELIETFFT